MAGAIYLSTVEEIDFTMRQADDMSLVGTQKSTLMKYHSLLSSIAQQNYPASRRPILIAVFRHSKQAPPRKNDISPLQQGIELLGLNELLWALVACSLNDNAY